MPEYVVKSGTTYRIITDHLGSVRLVINQTTGAVTQKMSFDEFGVVLTDSNSTFTPFGFAGGIFDPATELVRFGARDYDANVGRWLAKDPIGFGGNDQNLFQYCSADPINSIDPQGLFTPPYHYAISYMAARAMGFSHGQASMIAFYTVYADRLSTQGTGASQTAIHAMAGLDPVTGEYQSPEIARLNTENYISSRLALAEQSQRKGNCLSYYYYLGHALHAAQDQWAREHGYKRWNGGFPTMEHTEGDVFPTLTELSSAFGSSILVIGGKVGPAIRR